VSPRPRPRAKKKSPSSGWGNESRVEEGAARYELVELEGGGEKRSGPYSGSPPASCVFDYSIIRREIRASLHDSIVLLYFSISLFNARRTVIRFCGSTLTESLS
jgi:hypothetical protein